MSLPHPNLYDALDLPEDADAAAIKAAYKKRSKETHPDAGGKPEAFRAVKLAYDVLGDPEKRRRYDETGLVEEDKPDSTRAAALGVIEMALAKVMTPYLAGGRPPDKDPRWRDIVAEIKALIREEMHEARCGIEAGADELAFLRDMAERFDVAEGENFLRASFLRQIEPRQRQFDDLHLGIKVREMALAILNGVTFRKQDPYQASPSGLLSPYLWTPST